MMALVFRRMFFLPSGLSVDKHVLHGGLLLSSGSVKHSMCGRLLEVPVPRKMMSISPLEGVDAGNTGTGMTGEGRVRADKRTR